MGLDYILGLIERNKDSRGAVGMNGHSLRELPPEIGQFTKLTALYLGGNQLEKLPPEIGLMTELKYLKLDGNQLTALPPEIGNLVNLRCLTLHENDLQTLPPELAKLTKLTTLNLIGNLALHRVLPPEVIYGSPSEILSYYFSPSRMRGKTT